MRWLSVDPSCACSGVAYWNNASLAYARKVKPSRGSDEWDKIATSTRVNQLVYEAAAQGGKGYQTAIALERHRGDIREAFARGGCAGSVAIGVQEWRTVLGIKGPGRDVKGSTARTRVWKAAARDAVKLRVMAGELPAFALDGCDDEIDAVCIGLAWLEMTRCSDVR